MSNYSFGNLLRDVGIPLVLTVIIILCGIYHKVDSYSLLSKVLELGIIILPAIVTLSLTAYVFTLTFMDREELLKKGNPTYVLKLLAKLNSCFAISIIVPILSLLCCLIITLFAHFQVESQYANTINYIIAFIIIWLLSTSVFVQFGNIINIYNCGQIMQIKK